MAMTRQSFVSETVTEMDTGHELDLKVDLGRDKTLALISTIQNTTEITTRQVRTEAIETVVTVVARKNQAASTTSRVEMRFETQPVGTAASTNADLEKTSRVTLGTARRPMGTTLGTIDMSAGTGRNEARRVEVGTAVVIAGIPIAMEIMTEVRARTAGTELPVRARAHHCPGPADPPSSYLPTLSTGPSTKKPTKSSTFFPDTTHNIY